MTDEHNPIAKIYKKLNDKIEASHMTQEEIGKEIARITGLKKEQSYISRELRRVKNYENLHNDTIELYCKVFKIK